MPKKAEFLACQGDRRAGREFLLEYQRCVLLVLEQEGVLDPEQLERCVDRLRKQWRITSEEAAV